MKISILQLLSTFCILLLLHSLPTSAFTRVDTTLQMSDGVKLSVAYFLPDDLAPKGGWPAILSAHGFAGSKNSNASMAQTYADSGYFAVTWSIRGQGRGGDVSLQSEGLFNWFTGEREMEDVREILAWMGSRTDVNAERIGMEGISQGGLTTWGAIINKFPIRCAITMASVPHYTESHAHNGCNNFFTQTILEVTRGGLVNMGPFMGDSIYNAYQLDQHDELLRLLQNKELIEKVNQIDVPVFAQLAWQDDLFGTASLFRTYRDSDFPMKMLIVPGNHGSINSWEGRMGQSLRFYRRWLRDDANETIMQPDSLFTFVDPSDGSYHSFSPDEFENWTPGTFGAKEGVRFYWNTSGRLTTEPPSEGVRFSLLYILNLSNGMRVFRTEPLEEPLTMIGAETSFFGSSTVSTWQGNVLLWDYNPADSSYRQITRGSWQSRDGGSERRVEYQLSPQLYTIQAGHVLEARVKVGMSNILGLKPDDEFGKIAYRPAQGGTTTISGSLEEPAYVRLLQPVGEGSSLVVSVDREKRANSIIDIRHDHDLLYVQTALVEEGMELEFVDLKGVTAMSIRVEGEISSIPLVNIPSGYWFVLLRVDGNIVGVEKVLL
ncbi:MAG: prolyl oligopeptidase family serine peptidase [Ignavibacteriae bacterium]|nr:prolyl oligopeptidase family serine peptidase [Ignavibacteriota bacterium]MCB9214612.1 prolyl oligopeptidase family serine peptidase [Ignavibacteria bacterium]